MHLIQNGYKEIKGSFATSALNTYSKNDFQITFCHRHRAHTAITITHRGNFLYQSMKLWIQKFTMKSKYFGWVFPVFPIKCVVVAKPYVGWTEDRERIGTPGQVLRADIGSSSSKGVGGNEHLLSSINIEGDKQGWKEFN